MEKIEIGKKYLTTLRVNVPDRHDATWSLRRTGTKLKASIDGINVFIENKDVCLGKAWVTITELVDGYAFATAEMYQYELPDEEELKKMLFKLFKKPENQRTPIWVTGGFECLNQYSLIFAQNSIRGSYVILRDDARPYHKRAFTKGEGNEPIMCHHDFLDRHDNAETTEYNLEDWLLLKTVGKDYVDIMTDVSVMPWTIRRSQPYVGQMSVKMYQAIDYDVLRMKSWNGIPFVEVYKLINIRKLTETDQMAVLAEMNKINQEAIEQMRVLIEQGIKPWRSK